MSFLGDIGRAVLGGVIDTVQGRYGTPTPLPGGGWTYPGGGFVPGSSFPDVPDNSERYTQWAILAAVVAVIILLLLRR